MDTYFYLTFSKLGNSENKKIRLWDGFKRLSSDILQAAVNSVHICCFYINTFYSNNLYSNIYYDTPEKTIKCKKKCLQLRRYSLFMLKRYWVQKYLKNGYPSFWIKSKYLTKKSVSPTYNQTCAGSHHHRLTTHLNVLH